VPAQYAGGLVVGGVGEPGVDVRDGTPVQGGGHEQASEQILTRGVEERVGPRAGVTGPGGEVLRQRGGLDLVGDVGERIPPPSGLLQRDRLRVEDPHRAGLGAGVAGGVDDITLVGGDQHGAGGLEDGGHRPGGGLAGAGTPDVDVHVLPRPVERHSPRHGAADRYPRCVDAEAGRGRRGGLAADALDILPAAHVPGLPVDATGSPPDPLHHHDPADAEQDDDGEEAGHDARGHRRPRDGPAQDAKEDVERLGRERVSDPGEAAPHPQRYQHCYQCCDCYE